MREHRQLGAADTAARAITRASEHGLIWYAVAGLAAWRDPRRRGDWLAAGTKVAAIYGANTLLKLAAGRQRPPIGEIGTPTALSFPSSHAATCFAAARLFGDLEPAARPVLYGAAVGIASTRLHLLVHYPSDIAAGALFGEVAGGLLSDRR